MPGSTGYSCPYHGKIVSDRYHDAFLDTRRLKESSGDNCTTQRSGFITQLRIMHGLNCASFDFGYAAATDGIKDEREAPCTSQKMFSSSLTFAGPLSGLGNQCSRYVAYIERYLATAETCIWLACLWLQLPCMSALALLQPLARGIVCDPCNTSILAGGSEASTHSIP
jgi:hypothetical protein